MSKALMDTAQHTRVELEKLITSLSTQFINLPLDEIDHGINQALQTIGQLVEVDRSYIFTFSSDVARMDNTHKWCAPNIEPQMLHLQGLFLSDFPWFAEKIKNREVIYIPRMADLPPEAAAARAEFERQGIRSLINVPMIHHHSLVGFFGFDSVYAEKTWSEEDVALFQIVANMFVNTLERKQVELREALAYEFGRQLTTLLDPDTLLVEIVNRLQKTFGYYHAHVYLFNQAFPAHASPHADEAELLVMREGTGEAALEMKRRGHAIPLNAARSLVARAARSLEPVVVNDVSQNPDHLPNLLLPETRSEVALPLFLGQRLLGVLDVQHSLVNHFDQEEIRTLQIVASQLAVALSNARLFEENAHRLTMIAQAEAALRQLNEELEARVAERTAELTRQTQELARSNADLEQFAYVASHDLQEPLRMITSYVQLLARRYRGKLDADADDFINYAVDGATRMQQLINDLLAYSRVGTRSRDFTPTDCQAALNQVLRNLHPVIEQSGAVVTADPLPPVVADSLQLEQVFQNLIGNALKFRSQEPPQIHVSVTQNPHSINGKSGGEWIFAVRDNGIGIEPEYFERIFVIFQRLHGREAYPGTGIGLAVCKKIIERHNGRIWVESELGRGSTFYFTIPMIMSTNPDLTGFRGAYL